MTFAEAIENALQGFLVKLDTPECQNVIWIDRQELRMRQPLMFDELISEDWVVG